MARAATIPTFGLVLVIGFSGCTKAEPDARARPASPHAGGEDRKPARRAGSEGPPAERPSRVTLLRTPNGGIQPQAAVDARGTLHLIYFKGKAGAGDLYYVRWRAGADSFSEPIRVNSRPGSAIAVGTIRGGHLALGKANRVHVAWNGSGKDKEPPGMLYARLNDAGTAFEKQCDLMRGTAVLDGGGSLAADGAGNVTVTWHALKKGDEPGEDHRRVWVARSADGGKTFAKEVLAWKEPTGACACCGLRAFADRKGSVYVLYRSANAKVNRDVYLLVSKEKDASFRGALVHRWKVPG